MPLSQLFLIFHIDSLQIHTKQFYDIASSRTLYVYYNFLLQIVYCSFSHTDFSFISYVIYFTSMESSLQFFLQTH